MSGIANKRKNDDDDDELIESTHPSKRMRIEEIILGENPSEIKSLNEFSENSIAKRRNKLLTAIQLQKKYKYYCKKHSTTYLVESVRRKTKEYSKENRHNLVQSFRSLNVSTAANCSKDESDDCTSKTDKNRKRKFDLVNDEDCSNKKKLCVRPKLATTVPTKKNSPNRNFDEDEDSDFFGDSGINWTAQKQFRNHMSMKRTSRINKIIFSESEDSDYNEDYEVCRLKKSKVVKCFIVKKNIGENYVVFSETGEYMDSDDNDENRCDCSYHEHLKNKFNNYEYSSSSDDESDPNRLYYTG